MPPRRPQRRVSLPKHVQEANSFIQVAIDAEQQLTNRLKKSIEDRAVQLGKKKLYKEYFKSHKVDGVPLLHYAAEQGYAFLCHLLIDKLHFDVNSRDMHGATALHRAICNLQVPLVDMLIQKFGADANAKDVGGLTPLHLSILLAQNDIMEMLALYSLVDGDSCLGRRIHAAAFLNNRLSMNACIKFGADINHVLYGFCNPLAAAVFGSSFICSSDLIEGGAQINVKPLLYKAVAADNPESDCLDMVNLLVEAGADANAVDSDLNEDLPILCAAKRGRSQIVQCLLELTTPIEGVIWTSEGLMEIAKKVECRVNKLRSRMLEELKAKHFFAAELLVLALQPDMYGDETWKQMKALCYVHTSKATDCSYFELSVENLGDLGTKYLSHGEHKTAEQFFMAAQALDPDNEVYLQELQHARREEGTSH